MASIALGAISLPVAAARAQQATTYAIPAGALDRALTRFGAASGVQVLYSSGVTSGLQSPGLSGVYASDAAIAQLLSGTGLSYRFTGPNAVTISNGAIAAGDGTGVAADGSTALTPIVVQTDPLSTMNVPEAYAGGQVATGLRLGALGNRSIMDTPVSATSYTNKTIVDRQAKTLADVLENEPAVRAGWSRNFYAEQYTFRGFTFSPNDVSLDGIGNMFDAHRLPVELYDRVEVIRGPGTFLNGMSGIANVTGAINVIPKIATPDPVNDVSTFYSSNAIFGTTVDVGRRFGETDEFGARFAGTFRKGESYVDGNDELVGAGELNLDYDGGDFRINSTLGFKRQEIDAGIGFYGLFAGVGVPDAPDPELNLANPWQFGNTTNYHATIRAEYDITDNATAYFAYGRSFAETLFHGSALGFVTNDDADVTLFPGYSRLAFDTHVVDTGIRAEFDTGALKHNVVASLSGTWQDTFYRYFGTGGAQITNLYNPTYVDEPSLFGIDVDGKRTNGSAFRGASIADTISWNERVFLTLGGRFQEIDTRNYDDVTGDKLAGGYSQKEVVPFVGLVVKPLENLSIYASYIEGLQAGDTAPDGSANAGEMMAPFVTKQTEVGVKYDFGTWTATAALFQIDQPSAYLDAATNVYGQYGLQRNRGLELSVFGELTPDIRVLGGVAFMQGKLEKTAGGVNDGRTAIGVPKVQLNAGIEWDTPFVENLTLTGRVIHTSKQFVNADNSLSIPDWTRLDLGARYVVDAFEKPLTLRFDVQNVLNERYWASSARGFLASGAPRTFMFSASTSF